mmetsp:Transcript_23783/g.53976  ORF Transcript_23783/g.53976 Transcript_23783/m.53976 type:complete len:127 (-) Transcript_23783:723-1103(-)
MALPVFVTLSVSLLHCASRMRGVILLNSWGWTKLTSRQHRIWPFTPIFLLRYRILCLEWCLGNLLRPAVSYSISSTSWHTEHLRSRREFVEVAQGGDGSVCSNLVVAVFQHGDTDREVATVFFDSP